MQPFEARATVIRRRKLFLLLEAIGVVAIVIAAFGRLEAWASLALVVPACALAFGAAAAFARGLSPSAREASVFADPLGLAIDGRLALPRSMLRAAELVRGEPLVAVATSSWRTDLKLRFANNHDARAFVAALGIPVALPAPTFRATFGGMSRLHLSFAALIPATLVIQLGLGRVVPVGTEIVTAFVPLWILGCTALTTATVQIGAEGITIARFGHRPSFLGYAEIASITEQVDDLVFERRDGSKLRLGFADTRWLTGERRRPTTVVLARVREACSAFASRSSAPSHEAFVMA